MAQPPQSFLYQSVLRNGSGSVLTNQRISAKVSVLKTSVSGTAVYEETHTATSDAAGVVTLNVGGGTVVSGTFANIDWLADDYFLKTEIDPIGGYNYILTTTQQLLSVPFAFVSGKTTRLTGIDSVVAALNARLDRADSLIRVYNAQIRTLNDSIRVLSLNPMHSPAQLQPLMQRRAQLEATIDALGRTVAATRNKKTVEPVRQQAIVTRQPGHYCDR